MDIGDGKIGSGDIRKGWKERRKARKIEKTLEMFDRWLPDHVLLHPEDFEGMDEDDIHEALDQWRDLHEPGPDDEDPEDDEDN